MAPPNVLLLVVDSLRADSVLSEETSTPAFDRLREDGVTFGSCISQGISTAPSMTAMLTGRYPLDYGGHWYLEGSQPTFAEQFQHAGYTTGAVHSNPYVSAQRNFDKGFDEFEENVIAFEPDKTLEGFFEKGYRIASRLHRILSKTPYTPAPTVNKQVLSFVDDTSSPWFMWAQYMDVHGPYLGGKRSYLRKVRSEFLWRKAAVTSPEEITPEEHERLQADYRDEIEYLDDHLDDLLTALERRGELADTLVIVTADHGDEFCEHGRYGHGNLPYTELVSVPLIMRFPACEPQTTVQDLVRCVDILPTALDYADASLDSEMEQRCEGISLRPAIEGGSVGIDCAVTEKRVRDADALRIGFREPRWNFIYDGTDDTTELYDLSADPSQQTDVGEEYPEQVARFRQRLEKRFERISETSKNVTVPDIDVSAGVEERLRALGYRD